VKGISLVEKWKDLAKKESILIAGPDSSDTRGWQSPQDGPDYLHDLVEELKAKYPINPRRVYLFGHSAGASFALEMSLMESQYFAATAIHAGVLGQDDADLIDSAKRKIPIFIQVGDRDPGLPVKAVRATRDALNAKGFPVELTELPNHERQPLIMSKSQSLRYRTLRAPGLLTFRLPGVPLRSTPGFMLPPAARVLEFISHLV
jgi:pimeloyl-ACP methyl ester carboxylesterase